MAQTEMAPRVKVTPFAFHALQCLTAFAAEKKPLPKAHPTRKIEGPTVPNTTLANPRSRTAQKF